MASVEGRYTREPIRTALGLLGEGQLGLSKVLILVDRDVDVRSFRAEYGRKARAGLPLHTGGMLEWLAPHVLAAPWWRVL